MKRTIMGVMAVLLFVTIAAGSVLIVVQVNRDDKLSQDKTKLEAEAKVALEKSNASSMSNPQSICFSGLTGDGVTPVTDQAPSKLEGTILSGYAASTDRITTLESIDTLEGLGAVVKPGDTVVAHYTGAIASTGQIFQSSCDGGKPISFSLNGVIKGWTDGVPGMKVGGTRRLKIPAAQAYGEAGSGASIPPDSDLIFDIEITSIDNTTN